MADRAKEEQKKKLLEAIKVLVYIHTYIILVL